MMHLHRWSKWTAAEHYIDSSWGGSAPSTMLVKRCERCGMARSKGLYGASIPLDDREADR